MRRYYVAVRKNPLWVRDYWPIRGPYATYREAKMAADRAGRGIVVTRTFLARHGFPRTPMGEADIAWLIADSIIADSE
jgi:hypothetical protein